MVKSLEATGVDVVTIANNNGMDYGADALLQTISLCRDHGIVIGPEQVMGRRNLQRNDTKMFDAQAPGGCVPCQVVTVKLQARVRIYIVYVVLFQPYPPILF